MYYYHFSYDIAPKNESVQPPTSVSLENLSNRFRDIFLANNYYTPTVQSTYYYCDRCESGVESISAKINKLFNDVCTEEEKLYFMLKLDVCSVNHPNYIYTIDGVNKNLKLNPTDTQNEFV